MLTCRLASVGCRYDISLEVLYKLQTLRWDWLVSKVGIWICLQKFLCMLLSQSYQWMIIWCATFGKNVRKWEEVITRGLWFCYHGFIKFYFPNSNFIFQTEKEKRSLSCCTLLDLCPGSKLPTPCRSQSPPPKKYHTIFSHDHTPYRAVPTKAQLERAVSQWRKSWP